MAFSPQRDFFNGLSLWINPKGQTVLEGDVPTAARYVGLSKFRVYEMIESGDIEARQPSANCKSVPKSDAKGRRLGLKYKVNMADVFTIAYGEEIARKKMQELGLAME